MPKPCSMDLRERVVEAVETGASRREAAEWFDVSPSSAIKWMQRRHETGSIAHSLATGKGFSNPFLRDTGPTAWLTPVYPLLVAAAFKLFGGFLAVAHRHGA